MGKGRRQAFTEYTKDELVDIAVEYEDWILDLRKEISELKTMLYFITTKPSSETEIN